MANLKDPLKLLSVNCQGMRNENKQSDVLSYLKDTGAGIICLQDTYLTEQDLQVTKMNVIFMGKRQMHKVLEL